MAVSRLNGVDKVQGNVSEKTVTVDFDPQILALDDVLTTMKEMGYPAAIVSS